MMMMAMMMVQVRAVFAALQCTPPARRSIVSNLTSISSPSTVRGGGITLSALRRACRDFDVKLTESEARRMIAEAAIDDGADPGSHRAAVVNEAAFVRIMQHSLWY